MQNFVARPHLVTSTIPENIWHIQNFQNTEISQNSNLRNFACPPSFDFAYSSVRPHAKKSNSFTVLRLISVIMSAHFWGYITCYEPTSYIEVEHTVGSTAGKIALHFQDPKLFHFFVPFEIEPVLGFWKISSFVCTCFNDFWKHCFFPFCFFENEFVFLIFAPHFFQTRIHIFTPHASCASNSYSC